MRQIFSSFSNSLYYKELDLPPLTFDRGRGVLERSLRKRIALILAIFLAAPAAFAQTAAPLAAQTASVPNRQKIVPIDSDIYQAIRALHISRGLALPSTSGPWTEDELLMMLGRIDPAALTPGEKAAYDYAWGELNKPEKVFAFSGDLTLEAYGHSNPEDFVRIDDYIRDLDLNKPFLALDFELRFTPYAYGMGEISVGNMPYNTRVKENGDTKVSVGSTFFGANAFSLNVPMVPPAEIGDLSFNFPNRAFISLGLPGLNLEVGRERLSWGPGESGNFMVGSQVDYHNNIRLTGYSKNFKYIFNVSGFPSPDEYYAVSDNSNADVMNNPTTWVEDPDDDGAGNNFFIAHRLEWRILDKVNMALSEAIIYQPKETIDIKYFSPTIMLHNLYEKLEANSLLTLEVDWAVIPLLNIYGQIAVDQFHIPGEGEPGVADSAPPDAFAYMLGAKTALPLWGGMFSASLEGAYTDPYLYLRAQTARAKPGNRELNYVVANRYMSPYGLSYVEEFLGYRWGGDALVFNANAAYRSFGKWSAGVNVMFMVHGTFDKWTRFTEVGPEDDPAGWGTTAVTEGGEYDYENIPGNQSTPTDHHYQDNYTDSAANDETSPYYRNAPYYLTAVSLTGAYNIFRGIPHVKSLDVYGQLDLVYIVNKGNIKGNNAFDAQFTVGVSYAF